MITPDESIATCKQKTTAQYRITVFAVAAIYLLLCMNFVFVYVHSAFTRRNAESMTKRHKTCVFVVFIITVSVIPILRLLSTPSGEWKEHLAALHYTFINVVNNSTVSTSDVILSNNFAITDTTKNSADDSEMQKTGRYVSMCYESLFGQRRLGNHLFNLAAMLHVAWLTGRQVAMVYRSPHGWLDQWFQVPVTRVYSINREVCPCVTVGESSCFAYSSEISTLPNRTDILGKSLLTCGYFQSWKYTVGVESKLRHYLRLLPNVSVVVHNYMDQILPMAWKGKSFSRIGVHVRAGDILIDKSLWGYTIPQRPYFEQAMSYFVSRQQKHGGRVQFIVTSDSVWWVKKNINFTSIAHQLNLTSTKNTVVIDLVHSEGHDAGFDFAVLSLCDGVIMSTGTYGWWAGWLANKTTIYYSNWPRVSSYLYRRFKREDFFPPNWIPIGGPAFRIQPNWTLIKSPKFRIYPKVHHKVIVQVHVV